MESIFVEVMDAVKKSLQISLAWIGGHLTLKETDAKFIPFVEKLLTFFERQPKYIVGEQIISSLEKIIVKDKDKNGQVQ